VGGYNGFRVLPTLFLRSSAPRHHPLQNMQKLLSDLVIAMGAGVAKSD
jgi:hypothetical protein